MVGYQNHGRHEVRSIATLSALFFLLLSNSAYAYIDPGTGSVVTTAIIGFIAAVGYSARKFLYRLTDLFRSKKPLGEEENKTK